MRSVAAIAVVCVALALSSCTSAERPEPVVRVQRVEVPIPVPCVDDVPKRPESPVDSLSQDASLGDMVKAVLAERLLLNAYIERLESMLTACAAGRDVKRERPSVQAGHGRSPQHETKKIEHHQALNVQQ